MKQIAIQKVLTLSPKNVYFVCTLNAIQLQVSRQIGHELLKSRFITAADYNLKMHNPSGVPDKKLIKKLCAFYNSIVIAIDIMQVQ